MSKPLIVSVVISTQRSRVSTVVQKKLEIAAGELMSIPMGSSYTTSNSPWTASNTSVLMAEFTIVSAPVPLPTRTWTT